MSGGNLNIDSSLLRDAASSLGGLIGDVPQHSLVNLAGCGSSRVTEAAAQFDLWAALTGRIMNERIEALRDDATAVADEAERIDDELAAGTGN